MKNRNKLRTLALVLALLSGGIQPTVFAEEISGNSDQPATETAASETEQGSTENPAVASDENTDVSSNFSSSDYTADKQESSAESTPVTDSVSEGENTESTGIDEKLNEGTDTGDSASTEILEISSLANDAEAAQYETLALSAVMLSAADTSDKVVTIDYDPNTDVHSVTIWSDETGEESTIILFCLNNQYHWPHSTDTITAPTYTEVSFESFFDENGVTRDAQKALKSTLQNILYAGYPYNGYALYEIVKDALTLTEDDFNALLVPPQYLREDFPDTLGNNTFTYADRNDSAKLAILRSFLEEVGTLYPSGSTSSGLTYQQLMNLPFVRAANLMVYYSGDPITNYSTLYLADYYVTTAQAYGSTRDAIWSLLKSSGVTGNDFTGSGALIDKLLGAGNDYDVLTTKPENSNVTVNRDGTFTYNSADGKWHTGRLTLEVTDNYNTWFTLNLPAGITEETGKTQVKAGESFSLVSTSKPSGVMTLSATIPWMEQNLKVFVPNAKAAPDGKPFQNMIGAVVHQEQIAITVPLLAQDETSLKVTKLWNDSSNQDGVRPSTDEFASKLHLYSAGVEVTDATPTVTDNGNNTYTVLYSNLPKYSNGNEIVYTVKEDAIDGYTSSAPDGVADGSTITNSHTPEITDLSITKQWEDSNNQDGKRPSADEFASKIHLYSGDNEVTGVIPTVTDNGDNTYTVTYSDLPKYSNGDEIVYTVKENAIDGYTSSDPDGVANGSIITNSHSPEITAVSITKRWEDSNNQDGIRPSADAFASMIHLYSDDMEVTGVTPTVTDNGDNTYTVTYSNLPKYSNGIEIVYTMKEDAVNGYTSSTSERVATGSTITNSHTPEMTSVSGTKTWEDGNNQDGKRPQTITVNLLADGILKDSKSVSPDETGSWIYSFENLPKYQNGQEITYTVTENAVAEYSTTIDGYNITNSYTPGKTSVTVTKSWKDSNNQDGKRPENVTVQLLADGEKSGDAITLSEANSWTYTWSGLDKMKAGSKISYTVDEVTKVDGYTTSVTGSAEAGYIITNSHTPETVSVSGTKTWDDGNNQDGKRPDSITVNLLADGILKDSKSVSPDENGKWTYSFENLPKYQNGNKIVYTVSEEPVADYSTTIHGYDITNSYTPGKTSVTVTKIWSDSNNRDGLRPSAESFASKLHLYDGDAEVTGVTPAVTDNGNSTYTVTYSDLPAYANGSLIVYTVREDSISGYTADKESVKNGETLTNTHTVTPAPSPTSTPTPTSTPGSSAPGSAEPYTPNTSSSSGTGTAARPYTPNTSDRTSVPLYAGMFLVSSAVVLMMLTKWRKELFRR